MKSTAYRTLLGVCGILLIAWGVAQPQTTVRMEAENMQLDTYRIEVLDFASNGALINLKGPGFVGAATAPFPGVGGEYDISVVYHDENDGLAQLTVSIDDREVDSWTLDERIKGGEQPIVANRFTREIATGYTVATGDEITINGLQGNWDHANVDYIEFTPSAPPVVDVETEIQELVASDAAAFDYFGRSLAVEGSTMIIGAPGEDDSGTYQSGAAYVFTRSGGVWTEETKLLASDKAPMDWFGWSVAVDGNTAIIGAYREDDSGKSNNGAAYVFVRSDGVWVEQAKLLASDRGDGDRFGWSVAVDGDTAVIGAYQDDSGTFNNGAAYVFTRSGGLWTEQTKLLASDKAKRDAFGWSVAIDGDTVMVSAVEEDDGDTIDNGAVYVFTRAGGVWTEQAKLTASDKASGDLFGDSVAIDDGTAIVGANKEDTGDTENNGAAYIFVRADGAWTEQAKLVASDTAPWDFFGWSVAVDSDTAVIGAYLVDYGGAAYVFARSGGNWTEQAKLKASDKQTAQFGYSVAVNGDMAFVGASYYNDGDRPKGSGSAYTFKVLDAIPAKIDIAPFAEPDEPNSVRLPPPLQRVDVLVLSTNIADGESVDFDATQVDPTTTRFGPDEATAILRYVSIIDGDSDGDQDLFLKFNTYWTGIRCGDTEATLTGETYAGESFTGTDSVSPYPCP
jgi:hypothetical protein